MKIKTRIYIGLCLLITLTSFLVAVGWYQLFSLNNNSRVIEQNYDISTITFHIQRKVKEEAISLRNIILFKGQASIQQELVSLEEERNSVQEDILFLDSLISNSEQQLLVEELKHRNDLFNEYVKEVTNLAMEGNQEEALALINNNAKEMQEDFFRITLKITDAFEDNMNQSLTKMKNEFQNNMSISSLLSLIGFLIVIGYIIRMIWGIVRRLQIMSETMSNVASGSSDLSIRIDVNSDDEIDQGGRSFNYLAQVIEDQMITEQKLSQVNKEQAWVNSNLAKITTDLSGMNRLEEISRTFLSVAVPLVGASQAAFYMKHEDEDSKDVVFNMISSYAFKERKHMTNQFTLGEGLVGQAALEKAPILLTEVPSDYTSIHSGLGEATPLTIYVLPVVFKEEVLAVIEIASFSRFSIVQQNLLDELVNNVGIILDSTIGRIRLAELLEESQSLMEELQAQSEELQSQQEELRATNEELEVQAQALKQSEEKLQYQQEELEQTNVDLREKAEILEVQNNQLEAANRELEISRTELEEKAQQLTLSSKYKSEFLANMSHELRTPLNSLLILSKLLSENQAGNLTDKQVEFSKTIYSSSYDLLNTINDILDLAKIESGKMDVNHNLIQLDDLKKFAEKSFRQIAIEKNIEFSIRINEGLPSSLYSDEQRIQQVLQNLLSNAFKFTDMGKVVLEISMKKASTNKEVLAFSVADTGIGIPKAKQELIFEAFQQADGTTSRKFGGTGLGLSICRQIASLLEGEITVESEEGVGSTFTFIVGNGRKKEDQKEHLPIIDEVAATLDVSEKISNENLKELNKKPTAKQKEKDSIKRLLIVDDDLHQRNSLMELIGELNVIIKAVSTGAEAIEELRFNQYDCLLLDLGLSDTTGFELIERMNEITLNESIDIFIYTGRDLTSNEEMFLNKYTHTIIIKDSHSPQRLMDELRLYMSAESHEVQEETVSVLRSSGLEGKKVLLVDDDVRNVYAISNVLELNGMEVTFAGNGLEALKILEEDVEVDVILMDIMMPEMDGYETIRRLRDIPKFSELPIIALTAKAMKEDREKCLEVGSSDYIVKPVDPDQLMSLLKVWLHQDKKKW